MIPSIQTKRLTLRGPQFGDFDAYAAFYKQQRSKFVGGPDSTVGESWRGFAALAGQWMLRGYGKYIVTLNDGTAIGHVGPRHPIELPECEMGWCLWSEDFEGKGYVLEAMKALQLNSFECLNWTDCVSYIDPENTTSIAVSERLGAVIDPTAHHPSGDKSCIVYRHQTPEAIQ
ncbi:MAG: GNAT family N-acetyltransferase [Rhodobacteraceae bacterium]|nr:GNAT family N-acetyltransferase [Paracoccaceae bacterium]